MLAIRLQRTGRSGHAQFRIVVQDSHLSPKSGKVVANLGSYNPHTKVTTLDKEKASFYLEHGAQPSDRVVHILKTESVKLPKWVTDAIVKEGKLRNPEKLRKNQPAKPVEPAETPAETEAEVTEEVKVAAETPEVAPEETQTTVAEAEEQQPAETEPASDTADEAAKA